MPELLIIALAFLAGMLCGTLAMAIQVERAAKLIAASRRTLDPNVVRLVNAVERRDIAKAKELREGR
jgi:hypothetical protein